MCGQEETEEETMTIAIMMDTSTADSPLESEQSETMEFLHGTVSHVRLSSLLLLLLEEAKESQLQISTDPEDLLKETAPPVLEEQALQVQSVLVSSL